MNEHLDEHSMRAWCEGLQVSRSGFYAWRSRKPADTGLDRAIAAQYEVHRGRAGAPCLTADLKAEGFATSVRTVSRRMQRQGLAVRYKKKFRHTTDSKEQPKVGCTWR